MLSLCNKLRAAFWNAAIKFPSKYRIVGFGEEIEFHV